MWSRKYIFTIRDGDRRDGMHHFECLFSLPTNERPVPSIVIAVLFAFLPPVLDYGPRLFYSFEESDLRHEWTIEGDAKSGWYAQRAQQKLSLKGTAFESYLDSFIREKDKVRARGIDTSTAFERSRFKPPPACYKDEVNSESGRSGLACASEAATALLESFQMDASVNGQVEDASDMAVAMRAALRSANMYCDMVAPPASLTELLSHIFDAADEDGIGEMAHYEVARLMMATLPGFGLESWDINHLLSHARENDAGFINLKKFTKQAPDLVLSLREQRLNFRKFSTQGIEIPMESVRHCFEDEIKAIVDELTKAFEARAAEDSTRGLYQVTSGCIRLMDEHGDEGALGADGGEKAQTLVALHRRYCRDSVASLPERISPQEGSMVLQMLPEDENGFLGFEELTEAFENLRMEALLNAVVANDLRSLRKHLVFCARRSGLDWTGHMKLWRIKDILLVADQICLSRLQIHTLLCLTEPNTQGDVCIQDFLHICIAIIPHMSNASIFTETAERLMLENAEAMKERANAELAALSAAKVTKQDNQDDDDGAKVPEKQVDRETVERTLLQSFALIDETRKPTPTLPPDAIFNCVFNGSDQQVQGLCLDELEVAGLLAEMVLDASGEVPYHDFVRRWVPMMFELRQHPLLSRYLQPAAAEQMGIPEPDRKSIETMVPLMPEGMKRPPSPLKEEPEVKPERSDSTTAEVRRPSKGNSKTVRRRSTLSRGPTIEGEPDDKGASKLATEKLPPPGRGFLRRKTRMEDQSLAAKEKAVRDAAESFAVAVARAAQ